MLAHHPKTGEPIKIMRTSPSIHADNKTMIWVRETMEANALCARWFTVISEIGAIEKVDTSALCAIILTKDSPIEDWIQKLPTIPIGYILCAPANIIRRLDAANILSGINVFIVEDLYESYPFLGSALIDSDDVPTILCALAHILRMNCISWIDVEIKGRCATLCDAWKSALAGRFVSPNIPKTWLIQQYFHSSSTRRSREIFNCLEHNLKNPLIDHIVLLNEKEYSEIPTNDKIRLVPHPHRLTYYDVYMWAKANVPENDIIIFSNSDIHFDESLVNLWRIQLTERRMFLALLRWESDTGKIFGPRADSQDTWIFSRACLDWEPTRDELDFPFGKPGCDNVITYVMMKRKFLVVNPAFTIRTHHVHSSSIRNYDASDILYRPIFVYVEPSAISSLLVVKNIEDFRDKPVMNGIINSVSFPRQIEYVEESHMNTCISMLRYAGIAGYSANSDNLYSPSSLNELYHFKQGVFSTYNGLIYTFTQMIACNKGWNTLWESSAVESLTACIYVPKLFVMPIQELSTSSLGHWIVHYLSRALLFRSLLKKQGHKVEFLIPQTDYIGDFLNDCVWDDAKITVVPILKDQNYYSEEAWVVPPGEERATKEDIARLRTIAPKYESTGGPTVSICVVGDDDVCSREWAESVRECVFKTGWTVHIVQRDSLPIAIRKAFQTSNWIIGSGDALRFMWWAQKARILEFQRHDTPNDEYIHLAGACGHQYILGGIQNEPITFARQNALLAVSRAIQKFGFHEILQVSRSKSNAIKPVVVLPSDASLTGIYAHCGDTFREMVALWGERGYINIERSDTYYCWWDGVGKILLYDRPTSRWWRPDTPYQLALFGNCAPPGPDPQRKKQSLWGFWPRSPRAIERIAESCRNLMGWDSRPIESLFLGKVENGVQQTARCGADWRSCVELWSMPIDSTGAPYPFTQEQYLEKLCSTRFGLCLSGFGPKCNREIEYFACGVVPIVTPGVDMSGYLVPPVEGIHYLRATSPEDVKKVISGVSAEKWALMSAAGRNWWRTYASVEGFFRLTWARIEQCRPYFGTAIPLTFHN